MAVRINFLHRSGGFRVQVQVCEVEVGSRQDPLVDIDLAVSGGTFLIVGSINL